MYPSLEIIIPTHKKSVATADAIYHNQPFQLDDGETFLNFCTAYEPTILNKNRSKNFYLVFNGKPIKQPLKNKKTLLLIQKIELNELLQAINIDYNFAVPNNYEITPVNDIFVCDLLYAHGGIFEINEIHSAVFLPYFMENQTSTEKLSLIFANLVYTRFKTVSARIFHDLNFNFYIDDKAFNIDLINKDDFCRWLCLHEYMHNSGPLSLFRSTANKFAAKHYGFIEEMRVDLTTMKVLLKNFNYDSDDAIPRLNIIAIILLERILRGALYNFRTNWHCHKTGMFAKEVEGDIAICLLALFHQQGFINLKTKEIHLHLLKLDSLIQNILYDIYHYEQLACDKSAFTSTSMNFASWFRNKYIKLDESILTFLKQYSVQNCQYAINFLAS